MRTTSRGIFSRKIRLAYFAGAVALPFMAGTASADEVFKATSAVTGLDGQKIVAFDISFVDPTLKLYILGDRTNKAVDVVVHANHPETIKYLVEVLKDENEYARRAAVEVPDEHLPQRG